MSEPLLLLSRKQFTSQAAFLASLYNGQGEWVDLSLLVRDFSYTFSGQPQVHGGQQGGPGEIQIAITLIMSLEDGRSSWFRGLFGLQRQTVSVVLRDPGWLTSDGMLLGNDEVATYDAQVHELHTELRDDLVMSRVTLHAQPFHHMTKLDEARLKVDSVMDMGIEVQSPVLTPPMAEIDLSGLEHLSCMTTSWS